MRGDRLISILLMLQAQGQMTAKELAERLEVSERTIYRDMEALSGAGIPVVAERGINGGWSLLDDYQTTLTGLKESEIRALFVPLSEQLLDDLGLTRISEEARNKLIASLPSVYRQNAKDVWNRIYIDTRSWRHKKEKAVSFEVLKDAIWKDRKLNIVYQRADGQTAARIVAPLGLVAKGSNWYLIASKENGEIRNYRASRIQSAIPVRETFERPENFDLAQVWQSSTKEFIERLPTYEVRVKAAQAILPRLSFTNHFVRIIETNEIDQEGWVPVTLSFDTEDEAKRYILGFAEHMRIIEPKELHGKILKMAESIVAHYKS
ncbi:helix-turn-helix transcriptional regulator [Bacillus haynesii]|uniref:helix-turn-helix transcriptional regulator n=1 Tax=Bacillus haynesii TaxID=1925021 RepID=UPI001F3D2AF6|nr:YafY family protein [Bacillus haynesii]UIN47293.1 YafY family transcriptional regulator [Bacillus licheniformis]MCY8379858.1 YafY family transcriptional regulator [Bacillus haynesii]MCY8571572.1 YafY family transcriptional regulator [Bacillus haynesii]MCY8592489.1 YafY family transcriptional regulator [Bacillus haynesii]MCY8649807.1 YafY family transcriptional regulator [Bacillus haynesii]